MMIRTLKMELEPTSAQRKMLDAHIEGLRYLYNAVITASKLTYRKTGKLPSQFDMNNLCTRFRHNSLFLKELHSMAVQYTASTALQACRACLTNAKRKAKKKSASPGDPDENTIGTADNISAVGASHFPRYKKRGRMDTYGFLSSNFFSLVYERNANGKMKRGLKLGKVKGTIKCYNQKTRMDGDPKTVRITRKDMGTYYRYSASISYDAVDRSEYLIGMVRPVGVDIGLKNIAALSDGRLYPNDRIYSRSQKTIEKRNRQLTAAIKKDSIPEKRKRINQLNHLFERIHNVRRNSVEKASRDIVDGFDIIYMEDLSVKGLRSISKNKGMKKSYDDASLGRLRTRIRDKAESAGRRIVLVNPKDTSQICSFCGTYVKKTLSVRWHRCPCCGIELDRDVNAALNILRQGSTREPVPGHA